MKSPLPLHAVVVCPHCGKTVLPTRDALCSECSEPLKPNTIEMAS